jgi:hypothetical protein
MTDEQKIVFAHERWIKTLHYFQNIRWFSGTGLGMIMKDPDKDERPYIFDAICKKDLSLWKINTYHEEPANQPELSMHFLLTKEDDHEQQKSLNILELDEEFDTRARYEQIISENRKRFLDVPYKIQSYYHNNLTELIFQQKLDDTSYIYLMNFYLEDDEDPKLRHFHQTLITLSKAEILDGYENPDKFFDEQIEIFRILKKEGIINEN